MWLCECQCKYKTKRNVLGKDLKQGKSKSCGCLQKEITKNNADKYKKYNTYDLSGDFGIGYTMNGEQFYFDLDDYEKIKDYCWYMHKDGYVVTTIRQNNKRKTILQHRLICPQYCPSSKYQPDHINGIRHDNRKSNLRKADLSQNAINRKIQSNNTSGTPGVSWDKKSNMWRSRITKNNKEISLGFFSDIKQAVATRIKAEEKYFGEWSRINSRG